MSKFEELVAAELARARELHEDSPSLMHAAGIIREEFEEMWDYVKQDAPEATVLREMVSLAAACQRAAEDLGFVDDQN